jgi:hypothetical protein
MKYLIVLVGNGEVIRAAAGCAALTIISGRLLVWKDVYLQAALWQPTVAGADVIDEFRFDALLPDKILDLGTVMDGMIV